MSYTRAETETGRAVEITAELDRDEEHMIVLTVQDYESGDQMPGTPIIIGQAEIPTFLEAMSTLAQEWERVKS
jgi:hypothetical protein